MKKIAVGSLLLLCALPLAASGWEWQLAAGSWTLQPWTSPAERQAQRIVGSEANRLLAPLLSEFSIIAFEPGVALRSRGRFISAGCWRRLAGGRFAAGLAAAYLDLSLPFTLLDERDIYYQGIPVAHVATRGEGQLDLRTFMLEARARWRAFRAGRFAAHAVAGLGLLRFNGGLQLPLDFSIQTIFGTAELRATEDRTLAELREDNPDIPAWSMAPSLGASLHYRLGSNSRLFLEMSLSQGTFLAAGFSFGR
jgi:hypothetical protein